MKRILGIVAVLILCMGMAHAAGTCVVTDVTSTQIAVSGRVADPGVVIVTLVCTADSGDGSFPATVVPVSGHYPSTYLNAYNVKGYFLYQVGRTPGSTTPTASYTTTITDNRGFALDLGLLTTNGSASAAQLTAIAPASTMNYPVVRGAMTVALTANSVHSAVITLDLIFKAIW